jgi:hypothetical protein
LESIKWDEEKVRDRCQQIVATEHAHPEAIGIIDELYTRDSKFLDGLEERQQVFVAEIPQDTRVWTSQPKIIRIPRGAKKAVR